MNSLAVLLLCFYGTILCATHPVIQIEDRYDTSEKINMDFHQHDMNTSSGMYFEELANLQVYHSEWAFVTYINLSYFATESEHLEQTVNTIQTLCDSIKAEFSLPTPAAYCDHTMPQLYNLLDESKEFDIKWLINHETESKHQNLLYNTRSRRKRRGFIGTISKQLFSSLSEDDAAYYRSQINALKTENVEHISFGKNQTTLFQETLTVLNNTMQSQMVQHAALQNQFNDIERILNNVTISTTLTDKLTELMQYTTFVISSFWKKQQYFFDTITTKSRNFQLIPPKTFMNELERVHQTVKSQGLHLPLTLTPENLSKFYQMASTEGRIIDNHLVLRFSIPLVEPRNFVLYKVISVPRRNENNATNENDETFSYVVSRNEYIALDAANEQFVTLSLDDVRNCHRIDGKNLICKQTFPIMAINNNLACEINLLRNTNNTSTCDFRPIKLTDEVWVKLQKPNTYLYTLPVVQTVAIVCPNSRTKLQLQDTGIIQLSPKCRIKTERVEIVAFQTIEMRKSHRFTPSAKFNASVLDEIAKAKNVKSLIDTQLPAHISKDDLNRLTQIRDNVDVLQLQSVIHKASAISALNDIGNGNNINPILLLIIGVAAIIIVIAAIIFCFKYCAVPGCNVFMILLLFTIVIPLVLFLI
ncbi:uncharacterized protein LOC129572658 [Sitodiplosis mosellana]|uniref:uncharacterized protein LOC129572658 n=1 Tax=Sitodiplosis mosellana TaxID=263140 RepID=UPI002444A2B8|nr:uncharacterized protein LOC129572658 [Sitodiplosis mosellana]